MNFEDTPEEAAFRAKARAWIDANGPREYRDELATMNFFSQKELRGTTVLELAKAWQKKKFDAGWAALQWPKEYGGAAVSPMEAVIWNQEEGPYRNMVGPFIIGFGMCGPTLMSWASEEQKQTLLPKLASGEEIWCQLFSEPAAGSDLAGIRTRAVKDGDEWVVNGQKIWTSGAHQADWGLLITRTDPTVAKHKGLTMFFLDMKSPGVEVRPIRQMTNESHFNEVYFTDVRIPDAQRLGDVGQGWQVSLTTLMNERMSIGGGIDTGFDKLLAMCADLETENGPAIDDPRVRSQLAKFAVRDSGLKYTGYRALSALSSGKEPGPENSIGKLAAAATLQEMGRFAIDLQGEYGLVSDEQFGYSEGDFQAKALRAMAVSIEGGSDQILRNIIAERVLGLPADVRADKGIPFDQIPTGGS